MLTDPDWNVAAEVAEAMLITLAKVSLELH
jgi:hypothetical protein